MEHSNDAATQLDLLDRDRRMLDNPARNSFKLYFEGYADFEAEGRAFSGPRRIFRLGAVTRIGHPNRYRPTCAYSEVDRGRWFGPRPRSIVARIDPQPAGLGAAAAGIEHRDRGVVGKQLG
jgi:hypothetical protein